MKPIFTAIIILCLLGCSKKEQSQFKHTINVNPTEVNQPEYEDIVKSIEYIPLETSSSSLVGVVENMFVADGRIYINSDRKQVLCFSKEGKFLFKIGNRGRGPGEYISPFSISVEGGIVYVTCQDSGKLMCYDARDGKFLRSIKLPKFYIQVVVSNGYIYGLDMTTKPLAIDAMSLENPSSPEELYSSTEGEYVYSSFTQLFQSGQGPCYWVDPLRGCVYELARGEMLPFIDIDFGEYEYSNNTLLAGSYNNDNTKVFGVSNFYHIGDVAVISFGGGDKDLHTLIIDLKDSTTTNLGYMSYNKVSPPEAYYKLLPQGIIAADNRFYKICVSQYQDKCGELPTEYSSYAKMKSLNPTEDNPTIVAYELQTP